MLYKMKQNKRAINMNNMDSLKELGLNLDAQKPKLKSGDSIIYAPTENELVCSIFIKLPKGVKLKG